MNWGYIPVGYNYSYDPVEATGVHREVLHREMSLKSDGCKRHSVVQYDSTQMGDVD